MVLDVHAWNIDVLNITEDLFDIGLVDYEKLVFDAGQVKDEVGVKSTQFVVVIGEDVFALFLL